MPNLETKKMEQIYQQVADTLVKMVPEVWRKIFLYAEYREGYSSVFFYYYPKTGVKPVYSLDIIDLLDIDEVKLDELEDKLYNCFLRLWDEFREQEQDQWTNLTYILDNTGRMKISYGYDDISQISQVEKQEKWETEYLK